MSRGQRLVNLAQNDRQSLEKLNYPHYESTKGTDLTSTDIAVLKKTLFSASPDNAKPVAHISPLNTSGSSPVEKHPKPLAYVSPLSKDTSESSPLGSSPTNITNNIANRRLQRKKSRKHIKKPRRVENCVVRKSERIKNRKGGTANTDKGAGSEDESHREPFEDSGSEYSPSLEATNSSSNTSNISISTDLKGKKRKRTPLKEDNAQENIYCIKSFDLDDKSLEIEHEQNSGIIPDKDLSISTILSNTAECNISDLGFDSNVSEGLKTQTISESKENVDTDKEVPHKGSGSENTNQNVVTVSLCTKEDGRIVRDKGHACYFCQRIINNNLARHLELKHSNESEVAKILALPKNSKKRRDEFINLARYGDFYYNCDVLAIRSGELILTRRPTLQEEQFVSYSDYGPCPECYGFFLKRHIWHHLKYKCTSKNDPNNNLSTEENSDSGKSIIAESNAILNGILGSNFTAYYITNVLNNFKDDEISQRCKEDKTILSYGAFLYEKYSSSQSQLIRQSMRQLGRLTLEMKKQGEVFQNLGDVLVPEKFDATVNATKTLCMSTREDCTKRPEFGIPSLALKIGYGIKKCVGIERGKCLRKGDLIQNKRYLAFLSLLKLEWSVRISSNALTTLYMRKKNAADLLPITSDLVKLSNFLESEIKKAKENLSSQSYSRLASLTLSRIILFNKRRSGEASKMTLAQYSSRPKWEDAGTQEMKDSLTPFENKLASTLTIVKIVGKRGRIVPIILTKDMKDSVDFLVSKRVQFDILCENPFVFAIANTEASHMRGHDCLKKWCHEAGLASPELVTSTKLRKYIATVCQVFDLTENEYDWLARHLGHDVRVHREFYRLQENTVELTKVSRMLLAVDQGEAHKFTGRRLNEIDIHDLDGINEDDEINEDGGRNKDDHQQSVPNNQIDSPASEVAKDDSSECDSLKGTLFGNQVICVCNDGHVLGFGGQWKEGWVLDGGPRRRLHYYNEWLVVYGKAGVEHPQPWSPLTKDHQRANLHLYWIGPRDPELLAYKKTDGEPLLVVVSKVCCRTIIVVEQKVTQKGAVSVEVSNFELIGNSLKRIEVTSVPLQTQVSCSALGSSEKRLLIGCIDGSLAILDRDRGSTRIVKAAFIATLATWHPDGAIVAVANEKGYLQYYDTALNCIKNQLTSEDCIPATLLDLSGYFNTQFNIVSISWGPKDLIISFEQGPLAVVTHIEGSLSFKGLSQRYVKSGKTDNAVKLLLSWDFNDKAFYVLQQITVQLLRQPLTEAVAQHLQDALGCFHSSPVPLSSQIKHKFGHQVISITRRFFYQLLRASMFETAFLLAVDVGHHDLFMDLHYVAVKLGETEMAAAARAQASALLSRCSSEASNCSRSSCSQCSDSDSCSSTENFEESYTGDAQGALTTNNVLTTNFMQPSPTTYKLEENDTKTDLSKKFSSRATYVKAPQVPSNFMKLNQSTALIPSLPLYRTLGTSYIRQYAENNPIQNKTVPSNNAATKVDIIDYTVPELPPYSFQRCSGLGQVKDVKTDCPQSGKETPPLPMVCNASNLGISKNCSNLNNCNNKYPATSSSFNTSDELVDAQNLISFDNNLMLFDNITSTKPCASTSLNLSKKNNTKVKFSDTVTAFIVPEVKRSVKPSLPSHITDPQRELAESLPLCHPNEEYLKDFTPINKESEKDLDDSNAQPKIKVVHFGVV